MNSRNLPRHARSGQTSKWTIGGLVRRVPFLFARVHGGGRAIRRLTISLSGLVLALGLSAAAGAAPANAWVWSSNVTLTGALNQCTNQGAQTAYVNAVFNNQRHAYWTGLGQPPHYSVTFSNVPGGSGGWAWIVVTCNVVGGSHGYWVHVYRPAVGTTLGGINL